MASTEERTDTREKRAGTEPPMETEKARRRRRRETGSDGGVTAAGAASSTAEEERDSGPEPTGSSEYQRHSPRRTEARSPGAGDRRETGWVRGRG